MRNRGLISGSPRKQSRLPLVLGFLAVFGISVALGYYMVGPGLFGGSGKQAQIPDQPPASASVPLPAPTDDQPKLKIRISEEKQPEQKAPETGTGASGESSDTGGSSQTPSSGDGTTTGTEPGSTATPEPVKTAPAGSPSTGAAENKPTSAPATKPAPVTKPAPKPPAPNSTAASAGKGTYRVQLGVFGEESTALQVAEQARSRGHNVSVVAGILNGRKAWRVQAGVFKDRAKAQAQQKKLVDGGMQAEVLASPEQ